MFNETYKHPIGFFSASHITILLFFVLFTIVFFILKNKFKNEKVDKIFRLALAIFLFVLEVTFIIWSLIINGYNADLLPFGLCSITLWLSIYALLFNKSKIIEITIFWALIGPMLSLIIVEMPYSFPHFRYIHYFFIHFGILFANLYFLATNKVTVTKKTLFKSTLVLFCIAFVLFFINLIFDTNYLFLKALPEAVGFFSKWFNGFPYYLPFFALVIFALFSMCFGIIKTIYYFNAKRSKGLK